MAEPPGLGGAADPQELVNVTMERDMLREVLREIEREASGSTQEDDLRLNSRLRNIVVLARRALP
jgi:hypothetical protein